MNSLIQTVDKLDEIRVCLQSFLYLEDKRGC
jgi:hypothetical protein